VTPKARPSEIFLAPNFSVFAELREPSIGSRFGLARVATPKCLVKVE
jgi:hypothetical protein